MRKRRAWRDAQDVMRLRSAQYALGVPGRAVGAGVGGCGAGACPRTSLPQVPCRLVKYALGRCGRACGMRPACLVGRGASRGASGAPARAAGPATVFPARAGAASLGAARIAEPSSRPVHRAVRVVRHPQPRQRALRVVARVDHRIALDVVVGPVGDPAPVEGAPRVVAFCVQQAGARLALLKGGVNIFWAAARCGVTRRPAAAHPRRVRSGGIRQRAKVCAAPRQPRRIRAGPGQAGGPIAASASPRALREEAAMNDRRAE